MFDLEIDGWKAKDETLTLRAAARLTGTLVIPEGEPFLWAYVAWRPKSGGYLKPARIGADGTFQSEQVQPGLDPRSSPSTPRWTSPSRPTRASSTSTRRRAPSGSSPPGRRLDGSTCASATRGAHLKVVSMGRLAEGRKVVDVEAPRIHVQEQDIVPFPAISRASRYQVYARRDDGKILVRDRRPRRGPTRTCWTCRGPSRRDSE